MCGWLLTPARESASAAELLIALRSNLGDGPNELSFEKGDEIELLERTDFGWILGRTALAVGLFPQSAAANVAKKFSLRRLRSRRAKFSANSTPTMSRENTPTLERRVVASAHKVQSLALEELPVSPKQPHTPRLPIPKLPTSFESLRSSKYSIIMADDEAQLTARKALPVGEEDLMLLSDSEEDSVESETDDEEEEEEDQGQAIAFEDDAQEDQEESDST